MVALIADANTRNPGDACSGAYTAAVVLVIDVFPPMPNVLYLTRFWNRPAGLFPARQPEWSGIPVSRKKILTVTHPSDTRWDPKEQARLSDVHPCAEIRSYPVSPL
jgi:hypothetical protein